MLISLLCRSVLCSGKWRIRERVPYSGKPRQTSTHARIISQGIKCHCVQRTEQATLQRTKIERKVGAGCGRESCFPLASLRGCILCKRPRRAGPFPPCCLYDGPRTYWHLVGEERGQGHRACIKNTPSNTNCAFVGNIGKVQSPMSMSFSYNYYPVSSEMRCWTFCLQCPPPTCTTTKPSRPYSKGT